jgi:hypothetical protein
MQGARWRWFKVWWLDQPDKTDPHNDLRVLCVQVGYWYFKVTWLASETKLGHI